MIPTNPIVWIDFETGGLSSEQNACLELAAYIVINGQQRYMQSYIREPNIQVGEGDDCNVHPRALAVNKIPIDMIQREGKGCWQVASAFTHFLLAINQELGRPSDAKIILGAKNVPFDLGFLNRLYRIAGHKLPPMEYRYMDLTAALRFLVDVGMYPSNVTTAEGKELSFTSLEGAQAFFKIVPKLGSGEPLAAHTALGDAIATHDVYERCRQDVQERLAGGPEFVPPQDASYGHPGFMTLKPFSSTEAECQSIGALPGPPPNAKS